MGGPEPGSQSNHGYDVPRRRFDQLAREFRLLEAAPLDAPRRDLGPLGPWKSGVDMFHPQTNAAPSGLGAPPRIIRSE